MANRILGVLFKKKYANGDTDTIYPKTRAQDVTTSGGSTLETIATKVNGIATGATKVAKSSTNGNILINGTQTVVYSHPNSGATAGTYNRVTVNAQGHVTSGSNVTDWTGTVSGNVSNGTVTSSQASSRSNLASGEKLSVSMGKIRKWFADLKSLAFVDKVGTANLDSTLTTFYNKRVTTDNVTQSTSITESGWVADARVIRTLQNQINTLNSKGQATDSLLNSLDKRFWSAYRRLDKIPTKDDLEALLEWTGIWNEPCMSSFEWSWPIAPTEDQYIVLGSREYAIAIGSTGRIFHAFSGNDEVPEWEEAPYLRLPNPKYLDELITFIDIGFTVNLSPNQQLLNTMYNITGHDDIYEKYYAIGICDINYNPADKVNLFHYGIYGKEFIYSAINTSSEQVTLTVQSRISLVVRLTV